MRKLPSAHLRVRHWLHVGAAFMAAACVPVSYEARPLDLEAAAAALAGRDIASEKPCAERAAGDLAWPPSRFDLRDLLVLGQCGSPVMRVAAAEVDAARARAAAAGLGPVPAVSAGVGRHGDAAADGARSTLSAALDLILRPFGQAEAERQLAALEVARASARGAEAWQRLRGEIRDAWVDTYMADRQLAAQTRLREARQQWLAALERRASAGFSSAGELAPVRELLSRDQVEEAVLAATRSVAMARLARATGVQGEVLALGPSSFARARHMLEVPLIPPAVAENGVRTTALLRHPAMVGALADYALAESRVRREVLRQYPEMRLSPGIAWDQGDRIWQLGMGFPLTFLRDYRPSIQAAEADRAARAAAALAVQADLLRRERQEREAIVAHAGAVRRALEVVAGANADLERTRRAFAVGAVDGPELRAAEVRAAAADLARMGTERRYLGALAQWEDAAASSVFVPAETPVRNPFGSEDTP